MDACYSPPHRSMATAQGRMTKIKTSLPANVSLQQLTEKTTLMMMSGIHTPPPKTALLMHNMHGKQVNLYLMF